MALRHQRWNMLHSIHSPKHLKQQQGTVVLLTAVVLALIMGILALTAARTSLMEQKITGNDIRAREAREAAEAGLEFAMAWANAQPITAALTCPGGTGCPTIPNITASTSGATYASTVVFTPDTNSKNFIKVVATAVGNDGSSAKAESWIKQVSLLNSDTSLPAPLIINGGLSNVTGNPSLIKTSSDATGIVTSGPSSNIDTGNLGITPSPATNTILPNAFSSTAWQFVFKIPLSQAIAEAQANNNVYPQTPNNATPFYYYNNGSHINDNYGSATKPIVIIIGSSYCPKINGGPTIYGIVYFSATSGCSDQGWGSATIYGSVMTESNITKLNANTKFIATGNSGTSGNTGTNIFLDYTTTIPGTWKDF